MDLAGIPLILTWVTVNSTTSAIAYTGNGTTAVFPYTWAAFSSADLVVYTLSADGLTLTELALTTDYTVSGVGVATGGNVTLVAGNLASGVYLFIAMDPSQVQTLLLQQGAAFNPADLMNALDLLTREVQATRRIANNSIQIPVAESLLGATVTLPAAASRASRAVGFDASGNVTVFDASGITPSGVVALTDGATITVNFALGSTFTVTIAGNRTFAFTGGVNGQRCILYITQGSGGSHTADLSALSFSTSVASPTLSTTAGKTDAIGIQYIGGAYRCLAVDIGF